MFYDVTPGLASQIVPNINNMKCINETLSFYGNINSNNGQAAYINFIPCYGNNSAKMCESPESIAKWMRGKFLMLLYNKVSFVEDGFKERTLSRSTANFYMPFDSTVSTNTILTLSLTEVGTQDSYFFGSPNN